MAKKIRVSDDSGVTFSTLPGNSGEMQDSLGQIVDTIFGQTFESNQPGLLGWTLNTNALYKGFAGYVATLKQISGAATAVTGETFTQIGTTKSYQIDTASKQVWDRSATIVVHDGATDVTAQVESYDYLNGIITFLASYTVVGAITADLSYFATSQIAKGRSFTLTQQANAIDNTDFETAQGNNGNKTYEADGLRTVTLEIKGVYATSNGFRTAMLTRNEIIIEIAPSGALTGSYCRGYFKRSGRSQSGDVGALEEETVNFTLAVPDDDLNATPFKWVHPATSTLSPAVQKAITAWQNQTDITVQYLFDGTNGYQGTAVVTEVSLAGGLEVMNEFTTNFQGSGEATAVP